MEQVAAATHSGGVGGYDVPSAYLPDVDELFERLADRDLHAQLRLLWDGETTVEELHAMDMLAASLRQLDGHTESTNGAGPWCPECGSLGQGLTEEADLYYHPIAALWLGVGEDE